MKNYFTIVLLLIVVLVASCAKRKKFDRIEATKDERYSIVYSLGKCGIYDNNADSLVTSIKYDNLKYSRGVVQDSIEITVWVCEKDSLSGLVSIVGENNEMLEIIFQELHQQQIIILDVVLTLFKTGTQVLYKNNCGECHQLFNSDHLWLLRLQVILKDSFP